MTFKLYDHIAAVGIHMSAYMFAGFKEMLCLYQCHFLLPTEQHVRLVQLWH